MHSQKSINQDASLLTNNNTEGGLLKEMLISQEKTGNQMKRKRKYKFADIINGRDQKKISYQNEMIAISQNEIVFYNYSNEKIGEDNSLKNQLQAAKQLQQLREINEMAIIKFNNEPLEARSFLIQQNLITEQIDDFALWLLLTEGLDKQMLGDFLGGHNDFNQEILKAYVSLFDFKEIQIDEAIRYFVFQFQLPKEAQQIERLINFFSLRYYKQNKRLYKNSDEVYVMTFSCILLNGDLHNPLVKNKMTKENYIKSNKQCISTLSESQLSGMYDRIKENQFETMKGTLENNYKELSSIYKDKIHTLNTRQEIIIPPLNLEKINQVPRNDALFKGSLFLKYGKYGGPKHRVV